MAATFGSVLALEPYYGGSHRSFLDGLSGLLPGGMELVTLPPHHWKVRMRLGAPWLARELARLDREADPSIYACLLCSSFVDVATLRGLAPAWARRLPILTYFHENQFAYPVRVEAERDLHFGLTNLTTAMASDRLAFNSRYNLETFLEGCRDLLRRFPDMPLTGCVEEIRARSRILPPGLDFGVIDDAPEALLGPGPPVIVWNHRWEHDKNPQEFFAAMDKLVDEGVDFRLVLLGQSFREVPSEFDRARERLGERIVHFGHAPSRSIYASWLKRGDVVVSTAGHEFFGMAVVEAVRAGCRPVLPQRLSYPELFPAEYLYGPDQLVEHLASALRAGRLPNGQARKLTERFSWRHLGTAYRDWLGSAG